MAKAIKILNEHRQIRSILTILILAAVVLFDITLSSCESCKNKGNNTYKRGNGSNPTQPTNPQQEKRLAVVRDKLKEILDPNGQFLDACKKASEAYRKFDKFDGRYSAGMFRMASLSFEQLKWFDNIDDMYKRRKEWVEAIDNEYNRGGKRNDAARDSADALEAKAKTFYQTVNVVIEWLEKNPSPYHDDFVLKWKDLHKSMPAADKIWKDLTDAVDADTGRPSVGQSMS
jgi:hypothetical protein